MDSDTFVYSTGKRVSSKVYQTGVDEESRVISTDPIVKRSLNQRGKYTHEDTFYINQSITHLAKPRGSNTNPQGHTKSTKLFTNSSLKQNDTFFEQYSQYFDN